MRQLTLRSLLSIVPIVFAMALGAQANGTSFADRIPIPTATPGFVPVHAASWNAQDVDRVVALSTLQRSGRVFLRSQGFSLVHYASGAGEQLLNDGLYGGSTVAMHRVDWDFVDARVASVEFIETRDEVLNVDAANARGGGTIHGGVRYRNVWDGVDFEIRMEENGAKYQFVLHAGADPSNIRLRLRGAGMPRTERGGALLYQFGTWTLRDAAPIILDARGAATAARASWSIKDDMLGFSMHGPRPGGRWIIDPFLQWSTFMGAELSDYARDVSVDADGAMYAVGYTASTVFPVTPGAMQETPRGNYDLFITKFTRDRRRVWTTLFGGTGSEEHPRIALAPQGDIVVAGSSSSQDLPVSSGAFQATNGGRYDVFLLTLNKEGQKRWCTYLGGSYSDECGGLAVDKEGRICVAGGTYSTNFPVTVDAQQTSNAGDFDMYVARFTASGGREWASYIGGWSMDYAADLALAPNGDVVIVGRTESTGFPAVNTGRQQQYGGGSFDAVLLRIDARSKRIAWATYLGGEGEDSGERVAVDAAGNIVVTGYTGSTRFPLAGVSYRPRLAGAIDAFLARFDGKGEMQWATYLGGVDVDKASGVAVDAKGTIVVTGNTGSRDFPVKGTSLQKGKGAGYELFLCQFAAGGAMLWSSLYGGEGHDISHDVAMDARGNAVVVGGTESRGFRTAGNVLQGDLAGLTDAFFLRVIFDEPLANAGRDTTICAGTAITLAGDAGGGMPPYQFAWQPESAVRQSGVQQPVVAPKSSTTFVLTVTDAEGAVSRDTVLVTVVPLPVVDAGPALALCPGIPGNLKAVAKEGSPPYSYAWSPAEGLNNATSAAPTVLPTRTTLYTLTVTDAQGCSVEDSVLVTVHPGVRIALGEDRTLCAGVPVTLKPALQGGTAPFRYTWTPAAEMRDASASEAVYTPRGSGMVIVTVKDANGCIASDTVRMTVNQPPVVDAGDALSLCYGAPATLRGRASGGKAPFVYKWSPGDGLSSTTVLNPQMVAERTRLYVLTVTDANGCSASDSVLVAVYPQPLITLPKEVVACAGVPVAIGAEAENGTPPYRYSWSPASGLDNARAAMPNATPSKTTTYTVTATDAKGCVATAMLRVVVQPRPQLRVADRLTLCGGSAGTMSATVRGGTPPYSYRWSPETGLSNPNIANPVVRPSRSGEYTITVSDASGCSVSEKVTVTVLDPPIADAGQDVSTCSGSKASLSATISGGRPPYRYTWNPSIGLSSARTLNPIVSVARTTVYTLSVTDASGCTSSDTVTVFVSAAPTVRAGEDVRICAGTAHTLSAAASGGTPPYRYQWSPATGLSNPASATPTATPQSSTRYTVLVTDALGCTAQDEVQVNVSPPPALTLPRELSICRGQGKRLELSVRGSGGPYRYNWTPREGLSDGAAPNPIANPIQTTTYVVTVTDNNGCAASATITVTVLPCNKADAGDDADLCLGERVRIGNVTADTTHAASFSWLPREGLDDADAAAPLAEPQATTSYMLTVRNSFGCETRDTVRVKVRPSPRVQVGEDVTICPGSSTQLAAQASGGRGPYRYQWFPKNGLSRPTSARTEARPVATTLYTVTVTDAGGCTFQDSVFVNISSPPRLLMPRNITVCEGTPTQIGGGVTGGNGPFLFFWSPPEGLDNRNAGTPVATPSRSMVYTVTVTDAAGCRMTDTVRLNVTPRPLVATQPAGEVSLCEGDSVWVTATEGLTRYTWSDGATGARRAIGEPGSYQVSAVGNRGCQGNSEALLVRVYPRPAPVISAQGPLRFCEGDSVGLDAGQGYESYEWSTGATTRSIVVRGAGEYSVRVKGKGSCTSTSEAVRVEVLAAPPASMVRRGDTLIAFEAVEYQWYRDGVPIPGATARMYVATQSGSYQVRTRNAAGCATMSEARSVRLGATVVRPYTPMLRHGRAAILGGQCALCWRDVPVRDTLPTGLFQGHRCRQRLPIRAMTASAMPSPYCRNA